MVDGCHKDPALPATAPPPVNDQQRDGIDQRAECEIHWADELDFAARMDREITCRELSPYRMYLRNSPFNQFVFTEDVL